jgi:hypothetical protein
MLFQTGHPVRNISLSFLLYRKKIAFDKDATPPALKGYDKTIKRLKAAHEQRQQRLSEIQK